MGIHEECGVFGVYAKAPTNAAEIAYYGLYALQHRGQESCGIVVNDDGVFVSRKGVGLVGDVFTHAALSSFPEGAMAVAHTRYATTGGSDVKNCQPIEVNHQKGKLALAHNGNLSNAAALRSELELSGAIFHTSSDTEIIAYLVTKERLSARSIEDAVSRAVGRLEGAFSLVMMSARKLICVRDKYGFRPLCFGETPDGTYVVASESCALSAVGARFIRDVEPGEMLVFGPDGVSSDRGHCGAEKPKHCVFEYIYFARPDSVIDGISVHRSRVKAGEILAETCPVGADVVVGVPDSGLDAALGYAKRSGIPYGIGLIKNKYVGRTFIAPDGRMDKVRLKLSAVEGEVAGKRVVLIDDSIVRGTTSKRIISLLRDAGASEIHMRVTAPPFLHPCYYGTDVDSGDELIAREKSPEQIAEIIGADSLGFFPADRLGEPVCSLGLCRACFTGEYPTPIPADTRKDRFERRLSESEN